MKALVYATVVVSLVSGAYFASQWLKARVSWYYLDQRIDGAALLVTCQSGTPRFRTLRFGFLDQPHFSEIEVYMTCEAANWFEHSLVAKNQGFFSGNETLLDLVRRHRSCSQLDQLDLLQLCHESHEAGIDWLLARGVDINDGDYGGPINNTILEVDEKMFSFLLSRGANPHLTPPGASSDSECNSIDSSACTTVELIKLHIGITDASEFPNVVDAWHRMLAKAIEVGA